MPCVAQLMRKPPSLVRADVEPSQAQDRGTRPRNENRKETGHKLSDECQAETPPQRRKPEGGKFGFYYGGP